MRMTKANKLIFQKSHIIKTPYARQEMTSFLKKTKIYGLPSLVNFTLKT